MKKQIDTLVQLQNVENQTDIIQSVLNNVTQRTDALDEKREAFEKSIEDAELSLNELKKTYRSWESDAQMGISRVKKSESKLRLVKSNKEYQALLKEIDDLKANISQIEDNMLECLDRMDQAEHAIASKRVEYRQVIDQIDREKEKIHQETAEKKKKLTQLKIDRNKICDMIDPELLSKYMMIKDQVKEMAIVPVMDAVCRGCHMNIPPQMYNEIQRYNDLSYCPHCQRMIYWDNS